MPVDVLTSGTSYTVVGTVTLVEGWGAGGVFSGGGGGAYTVLANPPGVGSTVTIVIGSSGTDTNWNSSQLIAKSGGASITGALASACTPSTGAFSGGSTTSGVKGGGGSAGPDGAGGTVAGNAGGAGDNGLGGAGGGAGSAGVSNVLGGGGGGSGNNGGTPGGGTGNGGSTSGSGQLRITHTAAVSALNLAAGQQDYLFPRPQVVGY